VCVCVRGGEREERERVCLCEDMDLHHIFPWYGVAMISWPLKNIGLFCRISSLS